MYSIFAAVDARTTPVIGTILSGFCAAAFAFLFSLGDLTSMISIGTLLAFTVVAGGVLVLRYQRPPNSVPIAGDWQSALDAPLLLLLFWGTCTLSAVTIVLELPVYLMIVFGIPPLLIVIFFWTLFESRSVPETFKCPLVPLVPCLATYINILLICSLPVSSFVRIVIWTGSWASFMLLDADWRAGQAIGMLIYFTYGVHHSKVGLIEQLNSKLDGSGLEG